VPQQSESWGKTPSSTGASHRFVDSLVRQPFEHWPISFAKIFDHGLDSFRADSNFHFPLLGLAFHEAMIPEAGERRQRSTVTPSLPALVRRCVWLSGVSLAEEGSVER